VVVKKSKFSLYLSMELGWEEFRNSGKFDIEYFQVIFEPFVLPFPVDNTARGPALKSSIAVSCYWKQFRSVL